jgi:hypothetical protein
MLQVILAVRVNVVALVLENGRLLTQSNILQRRFTRPRNCTYWLGALRLPWDIRLRKAGDDRLRAAKLRRHFGAHGYFVKIKLLLARLGEARRAGARDAGALQTGASLHLSMSSCSSSLVPEALKPRSATNPSPQRRNCRIRTGV